MKTFKVSFLLTLEDNETHPGDWFPDMFDEMLTTKETVDEFMYEEVVAEDAPPVV